MLLFISQISYIFQPLMVKNWELHVHFKVHGGGKNLFGDGFAVWYARDRNQLGKNQKIYLIGVSKRLMSDKY